MTKGLEILNRKRMFVLTIALLAVILVALKQQPVQAVTVDAMCTAWSASLDAQEVILNKILTDLNKKLEDLNMAYKNGSLDTQEKVIQHNDQVSQHNDQILQYNHKAALYGAEVEAYNKACAS